MVFNKCLSIVIIKSNPLNWKLKSVDWSENERKVDGISTNVSSKEYQVAGSINEGRSFGVVKSYMDNTSKGLERIEEVKEESKSRKSGLSKENREEEKYYKVQKKDSSKEIDVEDRLKNHESKIFKSFENNQEYTKSTHDFIKKLETHFKNKKSSQEWTSFINTVHNLYTQHIGKLFKKKDNEIDQDTKNEYFIYLLYMSWEKDYFQGKMFKNWRENGLKTLEEMNDYCMININLDRLREDIYITSIKVPINISENNKNTYLSIFSEVLKILQQNNFAQPEDETTSKTKYLKNIQHFISNYANSNKWSLEERNLIKKNNEINNMIFEYLIEINLIVLTQDTIIFKKDEISKLDNIDENKLGKHNKTLLLIINQTNYITDVFCIEFYNYLIN